MGTPSFLSSLSLASRPRARGYRDENGDSAVQVWPFVPRDGRYKELTKIRDKRAGVVKNYEKITTIVDYSVETS